MGKTTEALHKLLEQVISGIGPLACTRRKGGKACVQQHDGQFDRDGRPIFWFGDGCRLVETFCPACRAYWHAAVARNALFDFDRMEAAVAADAARKAEKGEG